MKSRKHRYDDDSQGESSSDGDDLKNRKRRRRRRKHISSDSEEESSSSSEDDRRRRKERRKKRKHKDKKKKMKLEFKKQKPKPEELEEEAAAPESLAAEIISKFPALAGEFKQLLKMLDDGQGVDVSGIPDESIKEALHKLFRSLKLSNVDEVYLLPEGFEPTLSRLSEVLKGIPEEPELLAENKARLEEPETNEFQGIGPPEKPPPGPRVIGPAMPTPEMFAAAARLADAEEELRKAEDELPFIGPVPPTIVAEAASVNEAERFEEVARILDPDLKNAYEILGVKADSTNDNIKKRYWKLSLLVHPDKCSHPDAQNAFTTINKAFQELQDTTKRAAIDHTIAERKRKEEEEVELRALREAAQWRRTRGIELAGDDELLGTVPKPPSRDEWMTKLPPERQPGRPSMQSTFFSKTEKTGRGDTSVWTDTPLEKAQKARTQYLESYKQATIEAPQPEASVAAAESQRSSAIAKAVDSYNEKRRPESLVSKHKKEQAEKKKSGKKPSGSAEDWVGNHPWKPWDRETDLAAGRKTAKLDAASMASGLSSRFGSTGNQRKFL